LDDIFLDIVSATDRSEGTVVVVALYTCAQNVAGSNLCRGQGYAAYGF